MDPLKNAILIYKNGKVEDKCNEILSIVSAGAIFNVTYKSNGKTYPTRRNTVRWLTNPVEIDLKSKMIYLNGILLFSVEKILKFEDWYKVFYQNGKHSSYPATALKIVRTLENEPSVKDALSYLREVAESLKSEDDGRDFLSKQLEKMRPAEECALAKFLQKAKVRRLQAPARLIYPFGSNYSQMQAVKEAFTNDLSVIQGPPGTGKTQTILNVIANVLLQGKTVAVVSGNDEATRNVAEKMDKYGLAFLTAFLGNTKNIDKFFAAPPEVPTQVQEWQRLPQAQAQEINSANAHLEKALIYQIQIPLLMRQISELEIEKAINDEEYGARARQVPAKVLKKHFTSQGILRYAALLEVVANRESVGFLTKIGYFFKHGIVLSKEILDNISDIVDFLQNKYYALKLAELQAELAEKQADIARFGIDKLNVTSEKLGRNGLLREIGNKYANAQFNTQFAKGDFRRQKQYVEFIKRFPVIFSTTNALQSCTGEGFLYDYLIIDEASQVNILTACIAFACAKNVVLVGDKMQLPHVVKSDDAKPLKALFARYSLPKEIEYSTHSILDAVTKMYGKQVPSTLLNEHYRCDPQIIGFCNKRFYDGSLVVQTEHKNDNCGIKLITTEAHHASKRTNIRQAEIIERDIIPEIEAIKRAAGKPEKFTLGIVAPYRNQVVLLGERFGERDILIDTVHKFQGKEKTVVIMSTVSDRIAKYEDEREDFLNNRNLINVAISRAQDILYVIASTELLDDEGSLLGDLAKYIEYYCGVKRRHTTVYSVFDLMFDEYSSVLEPLKSKLLKISAHESENIIATLIGEICSNGKHGTLKFSHNYPLRKVLNTEEIKDAEDLRFARHPNTHCDFIIYNSLNKEIRLAIEVDGRQHNDPVQKARDERKDRLLTASGIKVLRLPTTAIECREKIEGALTI